MKYAEFYSLKYVSLDDALRLNSQLEPEEHHASKMVPVHPSDQYLMAISWEGHIDVSRYLPFGVRPPQNLFTTVVDAISWILFDHEMCFIVYYLDYF